MKNSSNPLFFATKFIAACAVLACTNAVFAHIVVEAAKAPAASTVQHASGPVQVANAWARATVPGQKGSGAFMTLTAKTGTRLVGVQSPVAGVAEVHEMSMEGTVMRMRAISGLDLPAGKAVVLKPGGFHLMLMDLKQTLVAGSSVPVTLLLQDAKGVKSQVEVKLPVSLTAPGGSVAAAGGMDHSKH